MTLPKVGIYPPQGYRKWWLAAAALLQSGLFVMLGKLTGDQWNMALVAILGLTGMSSVGEYFANRNKENGP